MRDVFAEPGPKRPTKKTPGYAGGDLNVTRLQSVKDCRLRAKDPVGVRVKSRVGVTGGYVEGADAGIIRDGRNERPQALYVRRGARRNKRAGGAHSAITLRSGGAL